MDFNNDVMVLEQVILIRSYNDLTFKNVYIYIFLQHCHNSLYTNEGLPNPLIKKLEFLFQNNKTSFLNRGKSLPSLR